MKRNARARLAATDPATLASLHRARIDSRDISPAEREYVEHWDTCGLCKAAANAAGMCSLGRHLHSKLTRGEE